MDSTKPGVFLEPSEGGEDAVKLNIVSYSYGEHFLHAAYRRDDDGSRGDLVGYYFDKSLKVWSGEEKIIKELARRKILRAKQEGGEKNPSVENSLQKMWRDMTNYSASLNGSWRLKTRLNEELKFVSVAC